MFNGRSKTRFRAPCPQLHVQIYTISKICLTVGVKQITKHRKTSFPCSPCPHGQESEQVRNIRNYEGKNSRMIQWPV